MDSNDQAPQQPLLARSRRSFFGVLLRLATAVIGAVLAIPVVRYLFYPLTAKGTPTGWTAAGPVSAVSAAQGPLSRTLQRKELDGWREVESTPTVYLISKGGTVQALSAICPHLGCIVPWDSSQNEFVCPCHGGVFGPDGTYRSGPPRRGMDTLETKIVNGSVMVKYQTFRPDVPNKQVTG